MSRWILGAVLLAGCGAPTSGAPGAEPGSSPGAPELRGGGAPVAGEPPAIAWGEHDPDVTGLPAVARDGRLVVFAVADREARGHPNLRLVARDRSDRDVGPVYVVLTADEAEQLIRASGPTRVLRDRIAAANRWLRTQHATQALAPLPTLSIEPAGATPRDPRRASGNGVAVTWRDGALRIEERAGDRARVLLERSTPADWLAPSPSTGRCTHEPFLAGAAVDAARSVALITIGYTGTDTCWEPPDQHHVIAW